jgi:hypothetical protein
VDIGDDYGFFSFNDAWFLEHFLSSLCLVYRNHAFDLWHAILENALDYVREGHLGHRATLAVSLKPHADLPVFADLHELYVAAVPLEHWPDFLERLGDLFFYTHVI